MLGQPPTIIPSTIEFGPFRFFATRSGHIGCGPGCVRTGGVVAILYGARVPFVLRPHNGQYFLIAERYVHSITYGEGYRG
jgi:hypothetical protein